MTTDELINRAEQRLNKTGNPSLPPEATLKAILDLGKERDAAQKEAALLYSKVAGLETNLASALTAKDDAEKLKLQADDETKEHEWIAHELGNFVRDIANGIYAGGEIAAANRVYDLNKGSLRKKRLNAYNYDSLQAAREAYRKHCLAEGLAFDEINMLEWLFRSVARA